MKSFLMAIGVMAIVSTGCEEIVFIPVLGGEHPSDPDSPPPPDDDPPVPSAIAMRAGDLPPDFNFRKGEDPDTFILVFNSDVQECPPTVIEPTCDNAPIWQLILALPPELDTPGLIDLSDDRIRFQEALSENANGCGLFGGEGFGGYRGTLEIISTDETSLFVKLRDTGMEGRASGDYTVQRCGAALETAPGG
ncbi:hypothetical protein [Sorangium cellulosum]|uniref:Uncharacterized protein n=1 Tax=Sorangium cellulosum TaxID=56 RepID=A0A150QT03_SORCE|nr:hypothetical protein [Sorangium cellulosum]KYF71121.1 hypothetical protein BE15_09435 [Sorangium cellulosum]